MFLLLSVVAPFGTSSEAREAQIVHVMVSQGEWILPTRNGIVPSKPPLHHWLAAAAGLGLGQVNEFVARLPSVLGASVVLFLTGALALSLAERWWGKGEEARSVALFSMLILGSTYGFTYMGTDARVDMTCTVFMFAACFCLLRKATEFIDEPRTFSALIRQEDFFWMFFLAGLAVLAKGPLGVVLPLVCFGAFAGVLFGWREALRGLLRPQWGWAVFLAVVAPWYVAAALKAGSLSAVPLAGEGGLLSRQLIFENVRRFFGGEEVNSEPWWFYVGSFARVAAPWSLMAAGCFSLWLFGRLPSGGVRHVRESGGREARARLVIKAVGAAFVAGFVLFSAASGKRHSYLLPIFPFLSVYLSFVLFLWSGHQTAALRAHLRGAAVWVARTFGMVGTLLLVALAILVLRPSGQLVARIPVEVLEMFSRSFVVLGAVLVASSMSFFLAGFSPRWAEPERAHWLLAFGAFALLAAAIAIGNGVKNELKGFARMSHQILELVGAGRLYAVRSRSDELLDPILFYVRREVTLMPPDVTQVPCLADRGMVVARREFFDAFVASAPDRGVALREFHVLRSRVQDALAEAQGLASSQEPLGGTAPGSGRNEIVVFSCEESGTRDEAEGSIRIDQPREVLGA